MKSQANIQGVYNDRIDHLNKFRRVMTDVNLKHNLISQEATIMLLAKSFDQYEDISSVSLFYFLAQDGVLAIPDSDGSLTAVDVATGVTLPERRVVAPFKKQVLFSKTPDMAYVQKNFKGFLVENSENYPYLIQITTTDMPRLLSFGDRLILEDQSYEVRLVQPINRLNDSVQKVMVTPVTFTDVPVKLTVDDPIEIEVLSSYKKLRTL